MQGESPVKKHVDGVSAAKRGRRLTAAGDADAEMATAAIEDVASAVLAATSSAAGDSPPPPAMTEDDVKKMVSSAVNDGADAVLDLIKQYGSQPNVLWWCFDGLYSLCAGDTDLQKHVYQKGGFKALLRAMRTFLWDPMVQTKAFWAMGGIAGQFKEEIGGGGGVSALVDGMRANKDEYQVQVAAVRCIAVLVGGSRRNLIMSVGLGVPALLQHVLDTNPSDGQLQWRGQQLMAQLGSLTEEESAEAQTYAGKRSLWARLRDAVLSGRARELAQGTIHGLAGVREQVEQVAQKGITHLLRFLVERLRSAEAVAWVFDALSTNMDNEESRAEFEKINGSAMVVLAIRRHIWVEEVALEGIRVLTRVGSDKRFSAKVGRNGAVAIIVEAMAKSKTNQELQEAGVRAFEALLAADESKQNLAALQEANTLVSVKRALDSQPDDHTLQYRGVRVMEAVQKGSAATMLQRTMDRTHSKHGMQAMSSSHSMRADSRGAGQVPSGGAPAEDITEDFDAEMVEEKE